MICIRDETQGMPALENVCPARCVGYWDDLPLARLEVGIHDPLSQILSKQRQMEAIVQLQ